MNYAPYDLDQYKDVWLVVIVSYVPYDLDQYEDVWIVVIVNHMTLMTLINMRMFG